MNEIIATKPALSVVIPSLGRPIVLQTLRSLAATALANKLDVILAGDIKDAVLLEELCKTAPAFASFRHLPLSFPTGDSSRKKTAGLQACGSDLVAFIDDDVVLGPDWPGFVIDAFSDPKVGMFSGPSLVPSDMPLMPRIAGLTLTSWAAGYVSGRYRKGADGLRDIRWSRIIGCNMAFRREAIMAQNGFDPRFWPGEEMLAAFNTAKQGYRIVFQPEASVYHYPRSSLRGFIRQIYGYGATRIRLIREGLEFEPTTLLPAILVLGALTLGLAAIISNKAMWLLLAAVSLYLLADALITLEIFLRTRRISSLLVFFTVPIMHIAYGIAEWSEFIRPNRDLSGRV